MVVCSATYVMIPSEATALAALHAFRGGCRPARAKDARITRKRRELTIFRDTIRPEIAPPRPNDVSSIVLNLKYLNYWLDSVRRFANFRFSNAWLPKGVVMATKMAA